MCAELLHHPEDVAAADLFVDDLLVVVMKREWRRYLRQAHVVHQHKHWMGGTEG